MLACDLTPPFPFKHVPLPLVCRANSHEETVRLRTHMNANLPVLLDALKCHEPSVSGAAKA